MHCADEGFEKPLPHLFEAAVFLMGFTLWGKLEFNKRDGFLDLFAIFLMRTINAIITIATIARATKLMIFLRSAIFPSCK